jgi:Tfp pilus assembly protein PilO
MSFETTLTDLWVKSERFFREIKVGFPEGTKEFLLKVCYDVHVWMSTHYMAVIALAVTAVVFLGFLFYLSSVKDKLKNALSCNEVLQLKNNEAYSELFITLDDLRVTEKNMNYLSINYDTLKLRYEELSKEIEYLEEGLEDEKSRVEDLEQVVSELEDELDMFNAKTERKDKEIQRLRELVDSYEELTEELTEAA